MSPTSKSSKYRPCHPGLTGMRQSPFIANLEMATKIVFYILLFAHGRQPMDFHFTEDQQAIRETVRKVCGDFPDAYWRTVDKNGEYPQAFVDRLTKDGWLSALIPEEYGGMGLGITEASIILEELNRSGGNATACHAQMYTMGTILRHGSEDQKR